MLQLVFVMAVMWLLLARGQRRLRELNTHRPLGADRLIERIREEHHLL